MSLIFRKNIWLLSREKTRGESQLTWEMSKLLLTIASVFLPVSYIKHDYPYNLYLIPPNLSTTQSFLSEVVSARVVKQSNAVQNVSALQAALHLPYFARIKPGWNYFCKSKVIFFNAFFKICQFYGMNIKQDWKIWLSFKYV